MHMPKRYGSQTWHSVWTSEATIHNKYNVQDHAECMLFTLGSQGAALSQSWVWPFLGPPQQAVLQF